jgi:ATP-dependent protease ClpP protease subunit
LSNQAKRNEANWRFWNFKPGVDNQPPELILYGDISKKGWWGDEITPKKFSDELMALGDVEEIVVRINSSGGDVFAAFAIYTRLKDHKARIVVKIDGWAASAATIIAMAGDVVMIPAVGAFMIHDPAVGAFGYYQEKDLNKLAAELQVIKNCIINAYALKTGKSQDDIAAIMSAETWYDGQSAVESGFCDELMFAEVKTEIENNGKIFVNSVAMNISGIGNILPLLLSGGQRSGQGGCLSNISKVNNYKEEKQMDPKDIKTVDDLKAAYPALVEQIVTAATAAERKRIKDIEDTALTGFENVVRSAKFEKPLTAADVSMQIVAQMKAQGQNYLAGCNADVQNSGMLGIGNEILDVSGGAGDGKPNPYEAAIDKLFPEVK